MLCPTFRAHGLEAKRLRFVHARAARASRVVLVEAKAAKAGGLLVLPPWLDVDWTSDPREERVLRQEPQPGCSALQRLCTAAWTTRIGSR